MYDHEIRLALAKTCTKSDSDLTELAWLNIGCNDQSDEKIACYIGASLCHKYVRPLDVRCFCSS